MALTRAFLKSMTLTDEQISAIIEEHSATVTGLKGEITKYKEDAEKVPDLQKKLEDYERMIGKASTRRNTQILKATRPNRTRRHRTMRKKPHTKRCLKIPACPVK